MLNNQVQPAFYCCIKCRNQIGVLVLICDTFRQKQTEKKIRLADQNHTTNMQELGTMQFPSVLNS